ncbi:MAG: MCE family protein [Candidatus Omnitrophica bacterium]|nr:MCE family protein [Candidatus Omnitrophota bacterium]
MHQRLSLEMKVGAFIVTGIALLIFLLFAIGDLSTYFQPGYSLRVVFDSANGIGRGSPVQYAGVEVGKVADVRIVYPNDESSPHVELSARLPRRVQVRTDDEAAISTFGLLGEKYLEIRPGPGLGAFLTPGAVLVGKPTVSTERIIERSNEVLSELKRTLEGLNGLVGDPEARLYLKEALQEARDATRNWKIFGQRLNMAMSGTEAGQGSLGKLLFDDELYRQLLLFVEDLQRNPWKLLVRPKGQKSTISGQQ